MGDIGPFSVQGHFGVIRCTCLKMACNSKVASRRAKQSEIWDWGSCNMYMGCLKLELLMFMVMLGLFGALVSKWPITRKFLAIEQNGHLGVVVHLHGVPLTF